jgi:hypothetical protein
MARMGDEKVHHFAHSKDACDEVLAYTTGLYRLIYQVLISGSPFYVPALVVSYGIPRNGLTESNIDDYCKIIPEKYPDERNKRKMTVSSGKTIVFDSAEIIYDGKKHMEAIELTYSGSRMAIKIMPPDTVCKIGSVIRHKDMATLVLDFSHDADVIQSSNSKSFREYLLSDNLIKYWIYNPKVKKVYPQILAESKKVYDEYLDAKKQQDEKREHAYRQAEEARILAANQAIAQRDDEVRRRKESADAARLKELSIGYEQVKDKFVQQTEHIRDSYGYRWVECEYCGEIKRDSDFSSYGGLNRVNLGHCNKCARAKEGGNRPC